MIFDNFDNKIYIYKYLRSILIHSYRLFLFLVGMYLRSIYITTNHNKKFKEHTLNLGLSRMHVYHNLFLYYSLIFVHILRRYPYNPTYFRYNYKKQYFYCLLVLSYKNHYTLKILMHQTNQITVLTEHNKTKIRQKLGKMAMHIHLHKN